MNVNHYIRLVELEVAMHELMNDIDIDDHEKAQAVANLCNAMNKLLVLHEEGEPFLE